MARTGRKYKTVIIGCGRIAGGYDAPGDKDILTHAHALCLHKRTLLSGVYDISYQKAKDFAQKWKTHAYREMETMLASVSPEIIFVCVPDKEHFKILNAISGYRPKAVVCEKPLGIDVDKAQDIIERYKKINVALAVNYTRRFSRAIPIIRQNIQSGKYGRLINACAFYTKGVLHNGSHAIDLLRYFFGEIDRYEVYSGRIDYIGADPTIDAVLSFKNKAKAHLIGGDEREYSIFEIDLLFTKARVTFSDEGRKYSLQGVVRDPLFQGYKCLGKKKILSTGMNKALPRLIDNLIGHIENGVDLFCSADDALETQRSCCALIKKYALLKKNSKRGRGLICKN